LRCPKSVEAAIGSESAREIGVVFRRECL
jgi:hypothetical protein